MHPSVPELTWSLAVFYGPAAPALETYLTEVHASAVNMNYYLTEHEAATAAYLSDNLMLSAAQTFKDALAKVAGTPYRGRVDLAKLTVYYVILLRWDTIKAFATQHSVDWPLEATKLAAFGEFARVYKENGMTHLSEGGHDLQWLNKTIFG